MRGEGNQGNTAPTAEITLSQNGYGQKWLDRHPHKWLRGQQALRKLMVITEQKTQPKEQEEEQKEEEEMMSLPQFAPTSLYSILGFLNPPHLGFLKYAQNAKKVPAKCLNSSCATLFPRKKKE